MINSITFINTLYAKPSASQTLILLGATLCYPCGTRDVKVIPTFSFGLLREPGTPMRPLNFTHPFTSQPSDTKHLGSGKRQWDGFHQLLLNPDIQLQAWGTNAYFLRSATTLLKQMFWEQHGAPGSLEDSRYSGKGLPEHCMHPME